VCYFAEICKGADEPTAFAGSVPGVQVVVTIVFQCFQPGIFSFAGEGLQELGDRFLLSGFTKRKPFQFGNAGHEIKEDEDLFF